MKTTAGFTLVEILVAMVVLAIGLLGMAAMTVMVMKGSRGASDLTASTNLCQLKLEELKDVAWANLGNAETLCASSSDPSWTCGLTGGQLNQKADLNSRGKTLSEESNDATLGPYKYGVTFVICKGEEYTGTAGSPVPPTGTDANLADTENCSVDAALKKRTKWLACESADITGTPGDGNPEKKIKVLCIWKAREGSCHAVHLDTTAVRLD